MEKCGKVHRYSSNSVWPELFLLHYTAGKGTSFVFFFLFATYNLIVPNDKMGGGGRLS